MEINVSHEQGPVPVKVLSLRGEPDCTSACDLEHFAQQLIAAGARYLLIDLRDLSYLSWDGIVTIDRIVQRLLAVQARQGRAEAGRQMRAGTFRSPHVKLVNPSPLARQELHRAGVDMYLEIYDDLKQAVASFGGSCTRPGEKANPSRAGRPLRERLSPILPHLL